MSSTSSVTIGSLCAQIGLAEEHLDKVISDLHLDEITQTACSIWKSLPPYKELKNFDVAIQDIDKENLNEADKIRELFRRWKQRKGSEATYRSLLRALLSTERRKDAEYLCGLIITSVTRFPEVVAEDSTPRQKTECLPTTIDPLTGVAESNENVDAFRPTILYEEHMKVCKKLEDQLEKAMEANETQGSRISELEQQLKTLKLSDPILFCCVDDKIIGEGHDGTVVYEDVEEVMGEEIEIAVKRMVMKRDSKKVIERFETERALMMKSQCEYVVQYYRHQKDAAFFYLVMERGIKTMYNHIEGTKDGQDRDPTGNMKLMYQAMQGVRHLHSLKIVHRDLKPHNILLCKHPKKRICAKISDFGLSKKYKPDETTSSSGSRGTRGWTARELHDKTLKEKDDAGFAGDIFTMGCVICFVRTKHHPFGDKEDGRQTKIENDEHCLDKIEIDCVAKDLIEQMISHQAAHRPTAEDVLKHCLFWDEYRCCKFFDDVNRILHPEGKPDFKHQLQNEDKLEKNADKIINGDWTDEKYLLPREGRKGKDNPDAKTYQKFGRNKTVSWLIHYVRNKLAHSTDEGADGLNLADWIKREKMGGECDLTDPEHVVLKYFIDTFPMLLLHTFTVMKECEDTHIKRRYYEL